MKCLNITGLILGFFGAALAFLDSVRTNSRLPEEGFYLEYTDRYRNSFWRWCGRAGFILLTVGFLLQLIAVLAS